MASYQFIDRPSPFNTSGGKTLPIFAVTPAHIDIGAIDPIALDWARKLARAVTLPIEVRPFQER